VRSFLVCLSTYLIIETAQQITVRMLPESVPVKLFAHSGQIQIPTYPRFTNSIYKFLE